MKRFLGNIVGLLALLGVVLSIAATGEYGNERVVVVSAVTISASNDTLGTIQVGLVRSAACMLTASAKSGSPTVDLYLQSVVGGVEDDYCRFIQVTANGSQILRFDTNHAVTTAAAVAVSDLSSGISAGNCRAGSPGDQLKVSAVYGGSGSIVLTLTCSLSGG